MSWRGTEVHIFSLGTPISPIINSAVFRDVPPCGLLPNTQKKNVTFRLFVFDPEDENSTFVLKTAVSFYQTTRRLTSQRMALFIVTITGIANLTQAISF
jgi:hypothetical protein